MSEAMSMWFITAIVGGYVLFMVAHTIMDERQRKREAKRISSVAVRQLTKNTYECRVNMYLSEAVYAGFPGNWRVNYTEEPAPSDHAQACDVEVERWKWRQENGKEAWE